MPRKRTPRKKEQQARHRVGRTTLFIDTKKSPYWQLQYNLHGRQIKTSLKTDVLKLARELAEKKSAELVMGTAARPGRRQTVAQVAASRRKRLAELGRKPATIAIYERFDRQLIEFLPRGGDTAMAELTPTVLEEFEERLRTKGIGLPDKHGIRRRGRPLAPKTVRDAMKTARGLIRFAIKRGLLNQDPSAGYDLPPGPSANITIFTPGELAGLYNDVEMGDTWKVLLQTCLRANEFTWLTVDDVVTDADGRTSLMIRRKRCQQTGAEWTPKHDKSRVVPLTPEAAKVLQHRLKRASGVPWLFDIDGTRGAQTGKWTYGRLRRRLHDRLDAIGAPRRGLHAFRHTGATFLANDGRVSLAHLQKFLGHRRISTTQRYLHPQADDVAASIQRVNFGTAVQQEATVNTTSPGTEAGNGSSERSAKNPRQRAAG
ncbi:MAG: tyrosine-type recombinase/integrase [Phycisphaeraceae bacterium]